MLLDENQHRLLMCCRMAKALEQGDIYLDATGAKMFWKMEKEGRPARTFRSIDEMESYLEHLLENRSRTSPTRIRLLEPSVRRRLDIIHARNEYRESGTPLVFNSRINGLRP